MFFIDFYVFLVKKHNLFETAALIGLIFIFKGNSLVV